MASTLAPDTGHDNGALPGENLPALTPSSETTEDLLAQFYEIIDYGFDGTTDSCITLLWNRVRFYLTVSVENLQENYAADSANNPTFLEIEYLGVLRYFSDKRRMGFWEILLENWVLPPCLSLFDRLAPAGRLSRQPTLEEYFYPTTYGLTLVNNNGNLEAVQFDLNEEDFKYLSPEVSSSEIQAYEAVPRIKASLVEILPGTSPTGDYFSEYPERVVLRDEMEYFFEAAIPRESFLKQLDALYRIDCKELNSELNLPTLHYIVESDDGNSIVGLLSRCSGSSNHTIETLLNRSTVTSRQRWICQIANLVTRLHDIGIVCGNIHPSNIPVDGKGDAWLVDFRGGLVDNWTDPELQDTFCGDLQSFARLEELLGDTHIPFEELCVSSI